MLLPAVYKIYMVEGEHREYLFRPLCTFRYWLAAGESWNHDGEVLFWACTNFRAFTVEKYVLLPGHTTPQPHNMFSRSHKAGISSKSLFPFNSIHWSTDASQAHAWVNKAKRKHKMLAHTNCAGWGHSLPYQRGSPHPWPSGHCR